MFEHGTRITLPSRHDELRALAEQAQRVEPGPWRLEDDGLDGPDDYDPTIACGWVSPHGAYTRSRTVNGYIAAVSPDVLLGLLGELAAAEATLEQCESVRRQEASDCRAALAAAAARADEAAAAHQRLKAAYQKKDAQACTFECERDEARAELAAARAALAAAAGDSGEVTD